LAGKIAAFHFADSWILDAFNPAHAVSILRCNRYHKQTLLGCVYLNADMLTIAQKNEGLLAERHRCRPKGTSCLALPRQMGEHIATDDLETFKTDFFNAGIVQHKLTSLFMPCLW
jgi:hypothetical protein